LSGKGTNTVGDPENFEIQSLWNAILGRDFTKFRRL
jgi:hypothetical protein